MTRKAELASIVTASALASFGVTLVNFARDDGVDVQVGVTFLVFVIAFGGLSLAAQRWAPKASPLLLPLVVAITGLGFMTVFSLSIQRAGLQRWWILIAAALAAAVLWLLSGRGTSLLRRYRNLILLVSVALLLLPNL